MKKTWIFFTAVISLLLSACDREAQQEKLLEQIRQAEDLIITAESEDIAIDAAVLYGVVGEKYMDMLMDIGILVSTEAEPTLENSTKLHGEYSFWAKKEGSKTSCGISLKNSEGEWEDSNGRYLVHAKGLEPATTYYYRAYFTISYIDFFKFGEIKQFTTKEYKKGTAVDIGLSVKWSSINLGAENPGDYGNYYAWGETAQKVGYTDGPGIYKWGEGGIYNHTKYNCNPEYGIVDNKTVLDAEDDAAHVCLGGDWRMPTLEEMTELVATRDNPAYKWEWKAVDGHNGWEIKYLSNGNSIFLPASGRKSNIDDDIPGTDGFYWSSSLNVELPYFAWSLVFNSNDVSISAQNNDRVNGRTIRPVTE